MTHTDTGLEARLRRLEDRAELTQLIARYAVAVDDRDLEAIAALFTPDGAFRSKDGVMNARGTEAVLEQFRGRFRSLKLSYHFSHDHIFEFGADPDTATGLVTAHAEVWRNGRALIGALRYQDLYRRHQGRWCFADRLLWFLYYLPVTEYASALGEPLRQRAYGDQRPADFPESLASWQQYHDPG
jgi:ketosteroid isomerase-like protein